MSKTNITVEAIRFISDVTYELATLFLDSGKEYSNEDLNKLMTNVTLMGSDFYVSNLFLNEEIYLMTVDKNLLKTLN